jgi:hypothetical protein
LRADDEIAVVGGAYLVFGVGIFLALLLRPFNDTLSDDQMVWANLSWFGTIAAFVIAFVLCLRIVRLYGHKSSEGYFWISVMVMLLIILSGIVVSGFVGDPRLSFEVYTAFNAAAFLLFMAATAMKLRSSGARPNARALVVSLAVLGIGLLVTGAFMMTLESYESAEFTYGDFNYADFPLHMAVTAISFALIFLSAMMAALMGGHISRGWYFMSLAAILNALAYSFSAALSAIGAYEGGHFVDGISIMALNAVAFSAYYQHRKHLELME